jgi:hypothetical protein
MIIWQFDGFTNAEIEEYRTQYNGEILAIDEKVKVTVEDKPFCTIIHFKKPK